MQGPPDPMLLDTCVVQHLALIWEYSELPWSEDDVAAVRSRLPAPLAVEILCLGAYVALCTRHGNGPIWAVSETSRAELARVQGPKGERLLRWWGDLWDTWSAAVEEWPEDLPPLPEVERPLPGQLELPFAPPIVRLEGPVGPCVAPLRDVGDSALVREAIQGGFPAILTTDQRSFWRHRVKLFPYGVEVWRPSDMWQSVGGEPEAFLAA